MKYLITLVAVAAASFLNADLRGDLVDHVNKSAVVVDTLLPQASRSSASKEDASVALSKFRLVSATKTPASVEAEALRPIIAYHYDDLYTVQHQFRGADPFATSDAETLPANLQWTEALPSEPSSSGLLAMVLLSLGLARRRKNPRTKPINTVADFDHEEAPPSNLEFGPELRHIIPFSYQSDQLEAMENSCH